jgi:hypothetical protein
VGKNTEGTRALVMVSLSPKQPAMIAEIRQPAAGTLDG